MSEKEEVVNRHFSKNKVGPVDVILDNVSKIQKDIDRFKDPEFMKPSLFPNMEETVSVKDTVKVVDKNNAKEMINKSNFKLTTGKYALYMAKSHRGEASVVKEEKVIQNAKKLNSRVKFGAALTAGLIGVGTILDVGDRMKESKQVERERAEQEKRLLQRQSQEAKIMKKKSHDYVDMGDIVQEMFNERIGHHKMGNSKFQ